MTIQPYPECPHARLRAAQHDIDHYVNLLGGYGLTEGDRDTAMNHLIVAARARRLAMEQLQKEREAWKNEGSHLPLNGHGQSEALDTQSTRQCG